MNIDRRSFAALCMASFSGCLHHTVPGDLYIDISPDSAELPQARFNVEVRNNTLERYLFNIYNWKLYKKIDGEERVLFPLRIPLENHFMGFRDYQSWNIQIDNNDSRFMAEELNASSSEIRISGLGPGTYVFKTEVFRESGESSIPLSSTFELTGPRPSIIGVGVESIEEGDIPRIVLTDSSDNIVSVERADSIEEFDSDLDSPQELLTEYVLQSRILTNSVYFMDERDISRLEISASSQDLSVFRNYLNVWPGELRDDDLYFRFDNHVYRFRGEDTNLVPESDQ